MLWRRADLEAAGGIAALAKEVAEDAAATKIVRSAGHKVRLIDRPLAQPLGHRTASEVWNRQLRWARLRRASFFLLLRAGDFFRRRAADDRSRLPGRSIRMAGGVVGTPPTRRSGMAAKCCWPRRRTGMCRCFIRFMALARDLLLPVLFVAALKGNDFVWRGNEMQVERMQAQRRRVLARVRPRVQKVADGGRRRLRSLRERLSER